MSQTITIKCPAYLVSFITLDHIPFEFRFNLLKAENERFRRALEEIEEREWEKYSAFLARAALEGK